MNPFDALLEGLAPGISDLSAPEPAPIVDFPGSLGLVDPVKLGEGGAGLVFRATDPILQRDVAVKVARKDARDVLVAEARLTARLSHPAVLAVHRVYESEGMVVAEYALAPSRTLGMWLANQRLGEGRPWSLTDRLTALVTVASAVVRAHEVGVVHGDLQPENILLSDHFEPYVIDWSGERGQAGTFSGTPSHAAPEQLDGEVVSPASDVFALGALACSLVTLRPLRPRREGERLADFVDRWRGRAVTVPDGLEPLLAEHIATALQQDPSRRPSAADWERGLRNVLSGNEDRSRRHSEAIRLSDQAQSALTLFRQLELSIARERQALTVLASKAPGWAPPAQKRSLWVAEARIAQLEDERTRALERAQALATQAVTMAPEADGPRQILADLYWSDLERAELALDAAAARRADERLRALGEHRYSRMLDAPGALEIRTSEPTATVRLSRWEVVERVRRPVEVSVHQAPCTITLAPGSWVLDVSAPGRADVRVPVRVDRMQTQTLDLQMFPPEVVGDDWVQIPAGAFIMGGDPLARMSLPRCEPWVDTFFIRRTCVTSGEWLAFLNALDPDGADAMVPGEMGLFGGTPALWGRDADGRYALPPGWSPNLPVLGVNIPQADHYCAWLSERTGRSIQLPTEEQWEKAARGVDGRIYPWGDHFDPTFCHMRSSRPGPPRPCEVGRYEADTSPYGVKDLAGGLREWTGSLYDHGQHVIRGGTFGDDAVDCRSASRSGFQPELRFSYVGFRLVWAPGG